jgi:hypothetical protein
MGYAAINVGPDDLTLDVGFLQSLRKASDLPLVSSNLLDAKGRHLFLPYVIKTFRGRRIAIFGIVDPRSKTAPTSVQFADPVTSIQTLIPAVREKHADILVALTQEGLEDDLRLARALPNLSLILGKSDRDFPGFREVVGKTAVFSTEEKGRRLGRIALNPKTSRMGSHGMVEMDKSVGEDANLKTMVDAYNAMVVSLFKLNARGDAKLLADACAGCHEREYSKWQQTDHARAYLSLVSMKREFDPECLRCHTTRFEAPGGFNMNDQQAQLRNVQCEACHGPAGEHASNPLGTKLRNPISQSTCTGCHTVDQAPTFKEEYAQYLERVRCR